MHTHPAMQDEILAWVGPSWLLHLHHQTPKPQVSTVVHSLLSSINKFKAFKLGGLGRLVISMLNLDSLCYISAGTVSG